MLPRMTSVFYKLFKLSRNDNDASVEMLLKSHKVWIVLIGVRNEIIKMVRTDDLLERIKANLLLGMPVGTWNLI